MLHEPTLYHVDTYITASLNYLISSESNTRNPSLHGYHQTKTPPRNFTHSAHGTIRADSLSPWRYPWAWSRRKHLPFPFHPAERWQWSALAFRLAVPFASRRLRQIWKLVPLRTRGLPAINKIGRGGEVRSGGWGSGIRRTTILETVPFTLCLFQACLPSHLAPVVLGGKWAPLRSNSQSGRKSIRRSTG